MHTVSSMVYYTTPSFVRIRLVFYFNERSRLQVCLEGDVPVMDIVVAGLSVLCDMQIRVVVQCWNQQEVFGQAQKETVCQDYCFRLMKIWY